MCVDSVPPPPGRVTRRGVLAGAAAPAGTVAALSAAPPAAAPGHGPGSAVARAGDLVIEGGTLLDPATGDVTEDAVVVIRAGIAREAGARARVEVPDDAHRLDAHGRRVLPGLVDAHIHLNTAAEAREAVRQGASASRLSALDAIRAATTRSAQLLGLQRTVGPLAHGFAGDAIVVDGDPLADVSVLKTPPHVVRAGLALKASRFRF
ncbi:amidohydrolase family protein [Streptomyces sp. NPDC088141]|uniref:amidohydrolase family protein n=1 Tax=Streptomyces sp. NPDC088141 TaxID=3155179 RepID=UPI003439A291